MSDSGIGTPYWYEWEIGIIECLKMLFDNEIKSVVLQSSEFQKLDDVVINYVDNSITNIQVKHTDIDSPFTYSFFSSNKDSLLKGLAQEWQKNKDRYNIREIQLVTNKKWSTDTSHSNGKCSFAHFVESVYPKLKKDFLYTGKNESEKKAIEWFKRELLFLNDNIDSFIKIFSFRAESGLENVEEMIKKQIEKIIGSTQKNEVEDCLRKILSALSVWATSRRKTQEITKEKIYQIMCSSNADIPQYELLPIKPIFSSRKKFAKKFISEISNTDKKIIFLQGLPGAGKTNFISYLAQLENSIVDFRYYTYIPANTDFTSYSDDEGFYSGALLWKSILVQLKEKFEEQGILSNIKFPIEYQYLNVQEMREYVIKYLPIYANILGRTCYLFIDGIDHAARSINNRNTFLSQIPEPEEIGENVKFILIGQPINDKYPNFLIKNESIKYCFMPSLEQIDIIEILKIYNIQTGKIDTCSLANTIISVVGNNALNVLFAVMELSKLDLQSSYEKIESTLIERNLNKQVKKYYEWIITSFEQNMLLYKLEALFANTSSKIPFNDILRICDSGEEDTIFLLNKMYPLIISDTNGYFTFHNDVRLYFKNVIIKNNLYSYIVNKFEKQIYSISDLKKYKYDILYNLLLSENNTEKLFKLVNADYIMQSVIYNISFNILIKQFLNILNSMIYNEEYKYLIQASSLSLLLSQFANCIYYYEKENKYIEEKMISKKKLSEMYILNFSNDLYQIIDDIFSLFKNDLFERGKQLFNEYLNNFTLQKLLDFNSNDQSFFYKLGYIYRSMDYKLTISTIEHSDNYLDFIDGWLEAGSKFIQKEDINITFCFDKYYPKSLKKFSDLFFKENNIDENTFLLLSDKILNISSPISVVIDLCIYGQFKKYYITNIVEYIENNLYLLKTDSTYKYNNERILGVIKAWFCIYKIANDKNIKKLYNDILIQNSITENTRGYKPSKIQLNMAKNIFDLFYSNSNKTRLDDDTIFLLIYFSDKYGAGSIYDCDGFKVIHFLTNVFINWSTYNSDSECIKHVCDIIIQCLESEKAKYISEFNNLFLLSNSKNKFMKLVEYWCGNNGKIWNQEYDEIEYCCTSISEILNIFGEKEKSNKILERLNLKLFGYMGRKDHSLITLLEYYKKIPFSNNKIMANSMLLLEISDAVSSIGDNIAAYEIDLEVAKNAFKLGYNYFNALFELKNNPKNFLYWREIILTILFDNINTITTDSELKALYNLTNAWINAKFEKNKPYGKFETLKKYNSIIINKIQDDNLRSELISLKNYDYAPKKLDILPSTSYKHNDLLKLLKCDGYSEQFENIILLQIENSMDINLNILVQIKNFLSKDELIGFTNKCVLKFILKYSRYGFLHSGIKEVLEIFYPFMNNNSWKTIIESIIENLSTIDLNTISNIGADLGIFTLGYILNHNPDKIEYAFLELCNTHINLITANGRICNSKYSLNPNNQIHSLCEMVKYQLHES